MHKRLFQNKIIHNLFEITVLMKGISGLIEIIVGIFFLFASRGTVYKTINLLSGYKVIGKPGRFTYDYLTHNANNLSFAAQKFIIIYFLFYGIVNIFLVVSLLRGKLWAYPVAIIFFILFIFYQAYRLFYRHLRLLLFLSIFDLALIILTWMEYQRLKKSAKENFVI